MAVAAIPAMMAGASTAIGLAGSLASASGQAKSGYYNATVARNNVIGEKQIYTYNSEVADINASTAEDQANWQADQTRLAGDRLAGQQKAYFGKYGLSGGSSADVMFDSAMKNQLDAMTEEYKGKVAATNYRQQGVMDTYRGSLSMMAGEEQANLYTMGANNAMSRGLFSAAGSVLTGAANTYGKYADAYPPGSGTGGAMPAWGADPEDFPDLIS